MSFTTRHCTQDLIRELQFSQRKVIELEQELHIQQLKQSKPQVCWSVPHKIVAISSGIYSNNYAISIVVPSSFI